MALLLGLLTALLVLRFRFSPSLTEVFDQRVGANLVLRGDATHGSVIAGVSWSNRFSRS